MFLNERKEINGLIFFDFVDGKSESKLQKEI